VNYRHAFHAGNAADCVKHALLVWILDALLRKPAPLFVLDTHAGVGRYDLLAGPAERTGEWRDGIARLLHDPPDPLRRYVQLVAAAPAPDGTFAYPGSPLLIRTALRPDDRLACCELHPDDAAALRNLFRGDMQVGVHQRDGYEAVRALLPPKQRRGLVLIDPPYEEPGEFERVAAALREGAARFGYAIYAAWYPIKHRSPVTEFHESIGLSGLRDVVAAEFWLRAPVDPAVLNGCGVLVRNPPYGFEQGAGEILSALLQRLGQREPGEGTRVLRLADE
jgi:23S rRNA (adenine2030-N6)-methyltransferase